MMMDTLMHKKKTFTIAVLRPSNNNKNTSNIFKYLLRALTNFHVFAVFAVHRRSSNRSVPVFFYSNSPTAQHVVLVVG
ncbi:unnamed protein product [Onchocerca flexuosa]|uniref:Ovule protein n=1 Tax=Onchocerca flexuosa TaxID=387005 RepID=A0A183HYQ3_9BILA|nr:unnamed protein product [Onchocerca flexuosa]